MNLHSFDPSRHRLSSIAFALTAALALPPAFAQTAPAAAPADPQVASAPTHEATPSTDPSASPSTAMSSLATPAAATPAVADASAKPATFKELDADKDGKLSRAEVAANPMWTSDFDTADADKDGYISKSEFRKHEADIRKTAKIDKQH